MNLTAEDRTILQAAAERLGTLAERLHEELAFQPYRRDFKREYERQARMRRIAKELLAETER